MFLPSQDFLKLSCPKLGGGSLPGYPQAGLGAEKSAPCRCPSWSQQAKDFLKEAADRSSLAQNGVKGIGFRVKGF